MSNRPQSLREFRSTSLQRNIHTIVAASERRELFMQRTAQERLKTRTIQAVTVRRVESFQVYAFAIQP